MSLERGGACHFRKKFVSAAKVDRNGAPKLLLTNFSSDRSRRRLPSKWTITREVWKDPWNVYAGFFPRSPSSSPPSPVNSGTHNCTIATGTIKIDLAYRLARLLSGRELRLKDRAADPPRPCPEFSVFQEGEEGGCDSGVAQRGQKANSSGGLASR